MTTIKTEVQPDVFYPLLSLPIAEGAARAAGAMIRRNYRRLRTINSAELLETTNKASENIIARTLRAAYPGSQVASEEGIQLPITPQHDNLTWWIDPLDGEANFAHGVPRFSVSVACINNQTKEILLGIVYDPMTDECFCAVRGNGATVNGEPIKVSRTETLNEALVASGFPVGPRTEDNNTAEWSAFVPRCQGIVSMESTALDMCYVATGRFDVYWESELAIWDAIAGILIVEEAGGRVTDYTGEPVKLDVPIRLLATNRTLHAESLEVLASAHKTN
jgi:myo-inositol-1(or 4)-monophosphatase